MNRAVAAIAFLLLSASAFAATATSAITGRVTSRGAPAAGVAVAVSGSALQHERTTVTTPNGRFWVGALPPGRYDITFSRAGLQTLTKRVVVELGRVTRAEGALEPSEDEESITATATTVTVAETTALTSHFSDETFDRLPMRRNPGAAIDLSPGLFGVAGFLNDAPWADSGEVRESLEEVTVLRGALPADFDGTPPSLFVARTRSGGETLFLSLRDWITSGGWVRENFPESSSVDNGAQHLVEFNAGGSIVSDRLWYFAGVTRGSELLSGDRSGHEAKLTWQPGAAHNVEGFYTDASIDTEFRDADSTLAALHYTGANGPQWTNEVVLSRSSTSAAFIAEPVPSLNQRQRLDSLFVKSTYVLPTSFGDHILSFGGRGADSSVDDETSFFINDRVVIDRLTVNAGLRHEYGELSPRVAAAWDVRGNGRQAISASFSDYALRFGTARELALGFATAVGSTGSIRVDGFRYDFGPKRYAVEADARYSLFGRFHTGTSYRWSEVFSLFATDIGATEHQAHVWAGVDLPLGAHEIGITAIQNLQIWQELSLEQYATDLRLRYSLPLSKVGLTIAADVLNAFDKTYGPYSFGRVIRGWVRLRL